MNDRAAVIRFRSETEAIEHAQRGSAEAFEFLFELHKARVHSLALHLVGRGDAEDVVQETFLLVFRRIGIYRGQCAFSSWLHRVLVNLVHRRRRICRRAQTSLDAHPPDDRDRASALRCCDPALRAALDRVQLERALRVLPHKCRTVVLLHDREGYEHGEIAAMLGCSIGNSKSLLHRGRMLLRELMQGRRPLLRRDEEGDHGH